ncbi:DUF3159 domain-containing protein [Blastococcus sp. CT_GayMR19]|uniref:DUF3159 domain-containing protein n=1 Tax=Blastococcus sp. CT_GayMR19 TaxID=2559608 RepID=UPI001073B4CA|nr:DUF3159 domain-containing protein [Blastococcus sp. CT_GayMR19]TFV73768.1 DUF3159 domain-containing protein [Blastococcus sp. CT_GayMR19]
MSGEQGSGSSPARDDGTVGFDRHLVLEQLGGWRGMVDATLPTVAFIVANSAAGLRTGIWAALGAAVLIFLVRLVRRESVQQAVSGLFAVGIAVAIAANSGEARDFFVLGIVRNAAIGVVLLGSVALRRPLIGYLAEFLAPSHMGGMAAHSLPWLSRGAGVSRAVREATVRTPGADPAPELHWREDPRALRVYGWLTVLWAATFLLRVVVQGPLYLADEVELLGTASLVLGLPLTAVVGVATLVVLSRLHRARSAPPEAAPEPAADDDLQAR